MATAANVHDSVVLGDLLHGDESKVWGDSANQGQAEVLAEYAPHAKDLAQEKSHRSRPLTEKQGQSNRKKSSVWVAGGARFFLMKRQFGFTKVRYKSLAKNAHFLFMSCALVNLVMAKKVLLKKRRRSLQATYA